MRYQIIAEYTICGKTCECLCNTPTQSGTWMITFDKNAAEKRVAELNAIGMKAWYEEVLPGKAWYDDENWIG